MALLRWIRVLCHMHRTKVLLGAMFALSAIFFVRNDRVRFASSYSSSSSKNGGPPKLLKDKDGIIRFSCPGLHELEYTGNEDFDEWYTEDAEAVSNNKTEFLSTFRTDEFDGWGVSYTAIKDGSRNFKSKYYPKYLKEGSHLYESACGIGLNLYMTLEIVQEVNDVQGITVYGNEYVSVSADKARTVVLADGVIPEGNRLGNVCAGDSTNLGHVPSEAFDVVYSGYITPMYDVLHVQEENDDDSDDYHEYDDICDAFRRYTGTEYKYSHDADATPLRAPKKHDWMGNYLWEMTVQGQRDWYGKWIGNMARIAKPGAPVIAEQISLPYCEYQNDWGGVDREFWYDAARENTYGWNIDPESIEMMDDTIHKTRYHVFMLKNK